MPRATISLNLQGDKLLALWFDRLPELTRKKISRRALRAGARIHKKAAEALIPYDSVRAKGRDDKPHLADVGLSIRAMRRSRKNKNTVGVNVLTPRRSELGIAQDSNSYYPAHLEYGHGLVSHGKGIPKPVEPQSYMRKAFDANRRLIENVVAREHFEGIKLEYGKLANQLAAKQQLEASLR